MINLDSDIPTLFIDINTQQHALEAASYSSNSNGKKTLNEVFAAHGWMF